MNETRRVVLVGGSADRTTLRSLVAEGYEAWGMNAVTGPFVDIRTGHSIVSTRWFQIHPPWACDRHEKEWAAICPIPLYTIEHYDEWPSSVPYPLDAVTGMPGALDAGFASTMAWALALAIHEGVASFAFCGVRLHRGTVREASVERANLAWWAGYAMGRGIDVSFDPDGHPATPPGNYLYGWEYSEERHAVAEWCKALREVGRIDGP